MDEIDKLVGRARRRLLLSTLLNRLCWTLFAAAVVLAIYVVVERLCYLGWPAELVGIGVLAAAALLAVLLTALSRIAPLHAAIEVDERASLRSRLATALELDDTSGPMAAAVMADAEAHSRRVDLGKVLPIAVPRRPLQCLVPAVLILLLVYAFVPQCDLFGRLEDEIEAAKDKEEIVKRAEDLKVRIEKLRKAAEIENLEMAQKLVDEVKTTADEMAEAGDKPEALSKLSELSDELESRRAPAEQLVQELKEMMESLEDFTEGEVLKELADCLKTGDMTGAAQALRKLQEKMQKGELSKEELKKMAEELDKLCKSCQGNKQMSKALQNLAKSLMANEAQALENLKQMLQEMKDMEKMLAEMEMMDLALAELSACKAKLGGEGKSLDELCQAYALATGGEGPGVGMRGKGTGRGGVSEDGSDAGTMTEKQRIRGQLDKGEVLGSTFVRGTPTKGQALVEYSEIVRGARDEATDALSKEEIPQGYKGLIKGYFDSIDPKSIPKTKDAPEKKTAPATNTGGEKPAQPPQ